MRIDLPNLYLRILTLQSSFMALLAQQASIYSRLDDFKGINAQKKDIKCILSLLLQYFQQLVVELIVYLRFYTMTQQKSDFLFKSNAKNAEKGPPLAKSDAEIKRQKKRKMAAFKSFFNHIQPDQTQKSVSERRLSGDTIQQMLEPCPLCKICNQQYGQNSKQCKFCHDIVCSAHFRKKRTNEYNKFARICDSCEDTFLYKKHLKNQLKVQETLAAQTLLLQDKLKELERIVQTKTAKLAALRNKQTELKSKTTESQKYAAQRTELQNSFRKLQQQMCELQQLQKELVAMQKQLPPSFQSDYCILQEQKGKIIKQLSKHQKWCHDIAKARSVREKKMYEEYYEWQLMQKHQRALQKKQKQQQCDIY